MTMTRPPSQVVLFNGKIVTVDDAFRIVDAIAVEGDRIVAVGPEARQIVTPKTKLLDLKGATVVPGLIDSHIHASTAGLVEGDVDLLDARSIDDVLAAINDRVKVTPRGEWVRSHPTWIEGFLKERRFPTPEELDRVSPDHPVYLRRTGFTYIFNSHAKRMLRINKDIQPEQGTNIIRDAAGEPIIFLGQHSLMRPAAKPATRSDYVSAIGAVSRKMNTLGITGYSEAIPPSLAMNAYQQLWSAGKLTARVNLMLGQQTGPHSNHGIPGFFDELGVSSGFGDPMLRLSSIGQVGMRDGVPGALMREPYTWMDGDQQNYYGVDSLVDRPDGTTFEEGVMRAARNGWRLVLNSCGDAMLDWALDLFERVAQEVPEIPLASKRHVACHPFLVHDDQLVRMKKLGIVMQSEVHGYMFSENIRKYWGAERAKACFPLRKLFDNGIIVGLGSDAPTLPMNPFLGMSYFVTRETPTGTEGAEHALSREETLRGYTINGAYLTGEEDIKGSLEPGKLADLAVLSDDVLTCPEDKIKDIKAVMTMLGGRIVHDERRVA